MHKNNQPTYINKTSNSVLHPSDPRTPRTQSGISQPTDKYLLNEKNIFKSKSRVWKILTALYGIFRKLAALQMAEEKQRNSEISLWLWVVKYLLLNGDKPKLEIDRKWSRDVYEAKGNKFWPWVMVEMVVKGQKRAEQS